MDIDNIKRKRFQFLYKLYELSEGYESIMLDGYQIGEELGFDRDLTYGIVQYLREERLVKALIGGCDVLISHQGIKEVEEVVSHPEESTSHFPSFNIISINQMTNSQIQQASPGAKQVDVISENKFEEVKTLIQSLKESIDEFSFEQRERSDIQAEIQTIEAQMSSSKPKAIIITESLGSIRRILEGAAGSILAEKFLKMISGLLG